MDNLISQMGASLRNTSKIRWIHSAIADKGSRKKETQGLRSPICAENSGFGMEWPRFHLSSSMWRELPCNLLDNIIWPKKAWILKAFSACRRGFRKLLPE